ANEVVAATGLADALVTLRAIAASGSLNPEEALFYDEQIDGPVAERLRVLALTLDAERSVVASRVAGLDDVDIVGAEDVSDLSDDRSASVSAQRPEQQLAILAVRLEIAAVYLRLVRG
ncbi:MAG TPA: TobH protein, partial [Mycobacterium sp.]